MSEWPGHFQFDALSASEPAKDNLCGIIKIKTYKSLSANASPREEWWPGQVSTGLFEFY